MEKFGYKLPLQYELWIKEMALLVITFARKKTENFKMLYTNSYNLKCHYIIFGLFNLLNHE